MKTILHVVKVCCFTLVYLFFFKATWLQEMSAGLFDEEDADEEETQIKTDVHRISLNPPVEREDAKTRRQKRKARESVEMVNKTFIRMKFLFHSIVLMFSVISCIQIYYLQNNSYLTGTCPLFQNLFNLKIKFVNHFLKISFLFLNGY